MRVSQYWKAVAAAVAAGAGSLGTAMGDGTLTAPEIVTAVLVTLGAAGLTSVVPNREPKDLA
ncbi:hypothetical protein ABZ471_32985 [Streptomyces sp. NPDC005728]|uniref:hypothetical protein n=1 Tax=Streptomyces sp. NPDC005728 TaxID=3157054 RepID=UPI003407D8F3